MVMSGQKVDNRKVRDPTLLNMINAEYFDEVIRNIMQICVIVQYCRPSLVSAIPCNQN